MNGELSIVLSGEAGQGVQTVENVLTRVLKLSGYHVFATKEYMSRVRGGCNTTSIRVSSSPVAACVDRIDILVPLSKERTKHLARRISPGTVVLEGFATNTEAIGALSAIIGVDKELVRAELKKRFSSKGEQVVVSNLAAGDAGYEKGVELVSSGRVRAKLVPDPRVKDAIVISGAEAIGLGALAGGLNFISAYPMTPSTGIFTFLSQNAAETGIISEQAEDEISAINMAIGAWYAGARAMVTTSGGGYDLMQEGLSLAGMLETPVVISLGMRPGPATGLPTRTEQGDLDLALYSGHGEFPRAIFAPGSIEQA
ncbi:MAG TPA: 2-oxoacid:acceptor oxidoreductase family protein, partial [Candidatus Omnitrophota bacterium]|nr:2-oxoacid:acceptor oxidoreductase family protein [Candidatus Omnitrophota bacterium]